jgi:hypothetical protein
MSRRTSIVLAVVLGLALFVAALSGGRLLVERLMALHGHVRQ